MPKRLAVTILYTPSQPQAPCFLEVEQTRAVSPLTIKRGSDGDDPTFDIIVRPSINEEADKALKMLLAVLEPTKGSIAHEGLCAVLEEVFFAGLAFAKQYPDQVNT